VKEAFIDTNPFIRYLTNDIPELAQKVENLLEKARKGQIKLITNELIIAEIVWVLESVYDLTKDQIYELLQGIFNTHNLEIPNKMILKEASEVYKDKNIDFIDAYTVCYMRAKGYKTLISFDKKHMKRVDWIELKEP
jgi:Predicted nucleic-acid-binding protein, contains PIN domain